MCQTLIVEDNNTFRQSLKQMLCRRFPSMTIDEAADGREAIQKIKAMPPDLVFMDIKLPGANGLDVTRQIKGNHSDVVVIVLTSYDLPEYREAAYKSGANYFFTKGRATSDEIMRVVESIASRVKSGTDVEMSADAI